MVLAFVSRPASADELVHVLIERLRQGHPVQRKQLLAPSLHSSVRPERRRLLGVHVHPRLLSCGACGAAIALRALALAQLPVQGRFRGLLDKCGRGRATCSPRSADASPASSVKNSWGLATLRGFCLGSSDLPTMQGLLARLVGRYARDAARPGQQPHGA